MKRVILILALCLFFPQDVFAGNKGIFEKGYMFEVEDLDESTFSDDADDFALTISISTDSDDGAVMYLTPEGQFIWTVNNNEVLKVTPSGDFYVNGRLTANDEEVYQQVKKWLNYVMEIIEDSD